MLSLRYTHTHARTYAHTHTHAHTHTQTHVKGCDFNFEVNNFQILKVATNETSTLH